MRGIHKWMVWGILLGSGGGIAAWTLAADKKAPEKEAAAAPEETPDPEQEVIFKRAKLFLDSFNKHDAKTLGTLFTEEAELVEADGDVVRGRKEIQASFEETFQENPQSRISLSIDSLRRVAPTVAIEDGRLTTFPDGKTAAYEGTYQVVHVKSGSTWLMAQARTLVTKVLSPHQHLKELEWLIGHWVDESDDSITETTCEWSEDRNFLLRKFTIKMDDQPVMKGVQRIGWDPLTKQFRSWVFDSEGGFVEGVWSRVGEKYVVKNQGVNQEGQVVSATNQFMSLGKDRVEFISVHRFAGNEQMPDFSVIMVRRPPKPKAK